MLHSVPPSSSHLLIDPHGVTFKLLSTSALKALHNPSSLLTSFSSVTIPFQAGLTSLPCSLLSAGPRAWMQRSLSFLCFLHSTWLSWTKVSFTLLKVSVEKKTHQPKGIFSPNSHTKSSVASYHLYKGWSPRQSIWGFVIIFHLPSFPAPLTHLPIPPPQKWYNSVLLNQVPQTGVSLCLLSLTFPGSLFCLPCAPSPRDSPSLAEFL